MCFGKTKPSSCMANVMGFQAESSSLHKVPGNDSQHNGYRSWNQYHVGNRHPWNQGRNGLLDGKRIDVDTIRVITQTIVISNISWWDIGHKKQKIGDWHYIYDIKKVNIPDCERQSNHHEPKKQRRKADMFFENIEGCPGKKHKRKFYEPIHGWEVEGNSKNINTR